MSFLLGTFLQSFQRSAFTVLVRFRDVFYKLLVVLLTSTVIVWMSVFLYGFFYYTYMPAVSHVKPVYLQFRWCEQELICDFPSANVTLAKKGQEQLLMRGQLYKVYLDLEMPESPTNQQLGMFMVYIEFNSRLGNVIYSASRSVQFFTTMLRYKSPLHQTLMTLFFTPLLLTGSAEEKQLISLELCDYVEEDAVRTASTVRVEIRSKRIEIYSAQLRIYAHFTGLRYLMFHWPVMSAVIGIGTNLFFLSVVALLSWYRYLVAHESHEVVVRVGFDDSRESALEKRRTHVKEFLMREKQRQSRLKASFSSFDVSSTNVDASQSSLVDKGSPQLGRTHSLDLFPTLLTASAKDDPPPKKTSISSSQRIRRQPRTNSDSPSRLSPSDMDVIEELEANIGTKGVEDPANSRSDTGLSFDQDSEESDLMKLSTEQDYDPTAGDAAERPSTSIGGVFTSDFSLGPLRKRTFVHQVSL